MSVGDERHERPQQRMASRLSVVVLKTVRAVRAVVGGIGRAGSKELRR